MRSQYQRPRTSLVASIIPSVPPASWYENPNLTAPTAITVTDDGKIFGHLAPWGTCHTGFRDSCVTAPKSTTDYAYFTIGSTAVECDDCDDKKVSEVRTGVITLGTLHAGQKLNGKAALSHYENTGAAVADVAAGEDVHGIWIAGALRPTVTEKEMRELRGAALSGDWRRINGNLELVAALAVNTPGFPVIRASAFVAEDGEQMSLVAAGALVAEVEVEAGLAAEPEVEVEVEAEETVLEKAKSIFANSGYYSKRKKKQMAKEDLIGKIELAFSPDQERDENGRWTSGGDDYDGKWARPDRGSGSEPETGKPNFLEREKVDMSEIKPGADLSNRDLRGLDLKGRDMSDTNLSGADLSDVRLTGANLEGAYLKNADLNGANLFDTNLERANLRDADLRNAVLARTDLYNADLKGADLSSADLNETNFRSANLRDADLTNTSCTDTIFDNANLTDADFRNATLTGAQFNGAEMTGVNFKGATFSAVAISEEQTLTTKNPPPALLQEFDEDRQMSLVGKIELAFSPDQERDENGKWTSGGGGYRVVKEEGSDRWRYEAKPKSDVPYGWPQPQNKDGADMKGKDLRGTQMAGWSLQEASLDKADLSGAFLTEANFQGAYLTNANLSGAEMTRSDLGSADLHGANANGANMQEANLEKAVASQVDFQAANLQGANFAGAKAMDSDFRNASLINTTFKDASLTNANFEGAKLTKTDLSGADMTGAKMNGAFLPEWRSDYNVDLSKATGTITTINLRTNTVTDTMEASQYGVNPFREGWLPKEIGNDSNPTYPKR